MSDSPTSTPEFVLQRRHFLAVLGVTACSTPAAPPCATCDDASLADAADVVIADVPSAADAPGGDVPADVSMACAAAGVRIAAVGDLAVGAYRLVQQRPSILVILGRDAGGYFAYSARCTHTGCTVPAPMNASALSACPCHNSTFDAQGRVQAGSMARTDLVHYAVTLCEGGVFLDRTVTVPIGTRAAVT